MRSGSAPAPASSGPAPGVGRGHVLSLPGSRAGSRPAPLLAARARPTARGARPPRRRRPRRRGPEAGSSSASTAACDGRAVGQLGRGAVDEHPHAGTPAKRRRVGRARPVGQRLAGQRARDELGGDRREQDPVAVVAGRPHEALERAAADRRQVVGRGGAQAGLELLDLQLEHARARARSCRGSARRRRRRSARCPSRAPPSSRRARSGRRRAGRGRPARRGSCASTRPGPRGSRSRSTWPLTGRTGTRASSGRPPSARDVHAGGDARRAPAATAVPSSSSTPVTRPPSPTHARPRAVAAHARRPRRSAATSRRGSIEWSPATSSASRTVGASAGSARRAWLGRSRSTSRPSDSRKAISRSSASASSASRATTSVPERRRPGSRPVASASSAQKASNMPRRCAARARAARARRTRPPRPARACPAATCHAPGSPASSTTARSPRCAARQAHGEADRPAADDGDIVGLRCCHWWRSLPTPVRPGSGSTVGGPVPPSQPDCGLPLWTSHSMVRAMTPRERIAGARLYLVCDARPREFLAAAIRGGVDVIQLRDKALGDDGARRRPRASSAPPPTRGGALFVLNDRPDLVAACAADGVHVGQDDGSPADARARSSGRTRSSAARRTRRSRRDAADADPDVDYLAVGPVHATPTKPGRPAAGLDYVAYAAAHVAQAVVRDRRPRRRQRRARSSSAARPASSSCARSPRPPTRRPRRARCAPRWRTRGQAQP